MQGGSGSDVPLHKNMTEEASAVKAEQEERRAAAEKRAARAAAERKLGLSHTVDVVQCGRRGRRVRNRNAAQGIADEEHSIAGLEAIDRAAREPRAITRAHGIK